MTMGGNASQKVWLVTGCSSGLGRSFVRAIVAQGDIAVATARDPETLRLLQAQHPGQVMPLALDVTRRDQIQQVVDHVIGTLGRIDGLINNAGYGYRAAVEEGTPEEVDRLFQTNFFGPVALIQAVLPHMLRQRAGAIVNISSIAAVNTFPGSGYYGASKCALEGLSSALEKEVASRSWWWNRGPSARISPAVPSGRRRRPSRITPRPPGAAGSSMTTATAPSQGTRTRGPGWCWRPSGGPSLPSVWCWGRTPGKCTPRPPRPTSPLWNLGWRRAGRRPSHQTPFDRTGKESDTMKRWTARLLAAGLALTLAACGSPPATGGTGQTAPATASLSEGLPSGDRILIAYFSVPETDGVDTVSGASRVVVDGTVLGNNQYLAQLLQGETGGDLFPIETVQTYPGSHDALLDFAYQERSDGARPALATQLENLDQYDVIFLGYPNWNSDLPMPLYTFLETYDFSGKTILPFTAHGGSGFSRTVQTIADLQPGATVVEDGLAISRNDVPQAPEAVSQWVAGLTP